MAASTLVLGTGVLPRGSAFDLSTFVGSGWSIPVWDPLTARARQGEMWLDYPFEAGFQGIGGEDTLAASPAAHSSERGTGQPVWEQEARAQIEAGVTAIVEQGLAYGFESARAWMIFTELLQNATAYGALSESVAYAGLIRLAWEFDDTPAGATLTVAVSNPIPRLFNPAKYCNISVEEYCNIAEQGGSGHVAVSLFVGFLADGQKLHYLWDLPDGSRIVCRLRGSSMADSEVPSDEILLNPAEIEVAKYDHHDREVPYSLDGFLRDVEAGLPTESVTVAGIFAKD
jgi:hypothetical protein